MIWTSSIVYWPIAWKSDLERQMLSRVGKRFGKIWDPAATERSSQQNDAASEGFNCSVDQEPTQVGEISLVKGKR